MPKVRDEVFHNISINVYDDKKVAKTTLKDGTHTWEAIKDKTLVLNDDDTGFDARVYENKDNPNVIIVGFRGTEGDKLFDGAVPDI